MMVQSSKRNWFLRNLNPSKCQVANPRFRADWPRTSEPLSQWGVEGLLGEHRTIGKRTSVIWRVCFHRIMDAWWLTFSQHPNTLVKWPESFPLSVLMSVSHTHSFPLSQLQDNPKFVIFFPSYPIKIPQSRLSRTTSKTIPQNWHPKTTSFYTKLMLRLYPSINVWRSHWPFMQLEGKVGKWSGKERSILSLVENFSCMLPDRTTEREIWKKRDLNIYLIQPHHFTNEETVKGVWNVKGRT